MAMGRNMLELAISARINRTGKKKKGKYFAIRKSVNLWRNFYYPLKPMGTAGEVVLILL